MTGLVGTLFGVLVFAWLARALLGARHLRWGRVLLAGFLGWVLGGGLALLLVLDLPGPLPEVVADPDVMLPDLRDDPAVQALAIPLQLLTTMGLLVGFEVVTRRPPQARRRPRRGPLRALRLRLAATARVLAVVRILGRHGLAPLVGLRSGEVSARTPEELARRVRTVLEEAGGAFVKLGQLLATRPDLLPPQVVAELGRLHARVAPLDLDTVRTLVTAELDRPLDEVVVDLDPVPLGSASIAQAHRARLADGAEVVLKVQRPGLETLVERDLAVLGWLARTAERRTAWGRRLGATALAAEFADTLRRELDFTVEARWATEMAEAVGTEDALAVPEVRADLTSRRLLVLELLAGRTVAGLPRDELPEDRQRLAGALCSSQVTAMLAGQRFHGDPHPGNLLLLDDGRLGLIDFGITGRLDVVERGGVFQLLLGLRLEDPGLVVESLELMDALPRDADRSEVERAIARFLVDHVGAGLPSPRAFGALLELAADLGLRFPPQTATMFRALATLAGTLEHLEPGFPIVEAVAEVAGVELREQVSPDSAREYLEREWARLAPVLRRAPQHADRIARLIERGDLRARVSLFGDDRDVRVLTRLVDRGILTVLSLGVALVSVLLLGTEGGPLVVGQARLLEVLGYVGLFGATVLLLRVLLLVLASDEPGDRVQ